MSTWLGEPIAERTFDRQCPDSSAAGFRIGKPRPDGQGDFECRFEIFGFGQVRRESSFGIDEVQALSLAFTAIRAELKRLGSKAIWLEQPAFLGLPVDVPTGLPAKYIRRIETLIARANAAFLKEAMSRRRSL